MSLYVRFDAEFLHLIPRGESSINRTKWYYDCKMVAVEGTINNVEKRSPELKEKAQECRKLLNRNHPRYDDFKCHRCRGTGQWQNAHGQKFDCYACDGKGVNYIADPIFMRRRCVDKILEMIQKGQIQKVKEWADKVKNGNNDTQPYKAVLIDIATLILNNDLETIKGLVI